MAWIAHRLGPRPERSGGLVGLIDLVVVRGSVAPSPCTRASQPEQTRAQRRHPAEPDVVDAGDRLVFVAFDFARLLVPERRRRNARCVAVASAALLLGFLVLATQTGTFSQMVGALRIENAIALFELGTGPIAAARRRRGRAGLVVLRHDSASTAGTWRSPKRHRGRRAAPVEGTTL